jgi:phosphate-selective porin OprO/OprP
MKALLGMVSAVALAVGTVQAGDDKAVTIEDPSSFCDIFDMVEFYTSDGPIQSIAYTGRLQADAAFFYPDQGDDYEELQWRRFRSGFKMKFLDNFTLHSEADLNLNDPDPLYRGLTDANIAWSRSDAFKLKIGKQSAAFTMGGKTSSKKLMRLERSLLSTNLWFPVEYHSGVTASGKVENWVYNVGLFSSTTTAEFGDFDAGNFGLLTIGYDFADSFGLDKALIAVDYVYNSEDEGNVNTRDLGQVVSLNGKFENGNFGVWTDVAAAEGYQGQPDLFAVAIMPFYNISEQWQLVASYNYVNSDGDNGVRLDRYESRAVRGRADEVHEFFFGVNYYMCGHKLKWQNGVEYTTASDNANDGGEYDGWGVTSGIRISW